MKRAPLAHTLIAATLLPPACAYAVCPVCTILVVSGVGLNHYLGIDDTITGIWIGGLILSISLTFHHWLKAKNIHLPFQKLIMLFTLYAMTIYFLYDADFIGIEDNTLWGYDKLILGIIIGSLSFLLGMLIELVLRALNECKVFFIFQRVVLPILFLCATSLIFYCITC